MLLAVTFCVCLIVSNLMEIKTVDLGPLTITAGVVVFPISYILNDCIVEVYGFNKARLVIWLGFGMNMLVSLLLQLGVWLPGADSWTGQEAMATVFGAVPRIFAASFIAFLCGSMVNAYVMRTPLLAPRHSVVTVGRGCRFSHIFPDSLRRSPFMERNRASDCHADFPENILRDSHSPGHPACR